MNKYAVIVLLTMMAQAIMAQPQKSSKRGVCENGEYVSQEEVNALAPGVSWLYTWGATPDRQPDNLGPGKSVEFVPMCWNGAFNEAKLTQWLDNHPGVKYLLGFNEPNFSNQANLTPAQAAALWPRLEQIAEKYNLKLVAPALNFSGSKVGGRNYTPYEWLDEFFENRPDARVDCLALHCYMNWSSAVEWFATRYFYEDLTNDENNGKYPHIVKYFETHGEKPMMLTEFCAWDTSDTSVQVDEQFQLDQMVEKIEVLERSPRIEGYAWFMAKGKTIGQYPYYRLFQNNSDDAPLTRLGTVYVNMSSFDRTYYYNIGEAIAAKDYVESSGAKLDLATDPQCEWPIEISSMMNGSTADYLLSVPEDGTYTLSLRINHGFEGWRPPTLAVLMDGKEVARKKLDEGNATWYDETIDVPLTAGNHQIRLANKRMSSDMRLSALRFESSSTSINQPKANKLTSTTLYKPDGIRVSHSGKGIIIERTIGDDGTVKTTKRVNR